MKGKSISRMRLLLSLSMLAAFCCSHISFLRLPSISPVAAASREPVRARHGIVASTNEIASRVGIDIMKRGGNAIDAAIAVSFDLALTHPAAGHLRGRGFRMIACMNG